MRSLRALASRVRGLATRGRADRELQQEIASHLDEATEEFVRQGMSPAEARRQALRSFGGVTQAIEAHREGRGWPGLESVARDVPRAVRLLRRSPAVTAAAVFSLALGMGGTTTMFSLMNGLMLRPLPVRQPDRLVSIVAGDEVRSWKVSVWEQMRDRTDLFDGLFAWDGRGLDLAERGESRPVSAMLVSGGLFDVLGLEPQAGRLLRPADDVEGTGDGPVVVISDRFWRRHYGGAPDVVGRRLRLNGASLTIVGITPPGFDGLEVGSAFDVAVPMAVAPLLEPERPRELVRVNLWLSIMARLKPGQEAADAAAALHAAMPAILDRADRGVPVRMRLFDEMKARMMAPAVVPAPGGPSALRDRYDRSVVTVAAIAVVVLLIACLNLANLFLARGEARRRELAIAMALGAPRSRLVRQLVLEGLVLAAIGAAVGLAIAAWAAPLLVRELSATTQVATLAVPVDWRLLAITGLTAVVAALIFSAAPALRVTNRLLAGAVSDTRTPGGHAGESRVHGLLVAAQVALSLILLVSAALLVVTFVRLQHHDLGFDPETVLTMNVSLKSGAGSSEDDAARRRRVLEAVTADPDVAGAAFGNVTMLTPGRMTGMLIRDDGGVPPFEREVFGIDVTPGWFETMGLPFQLGRDYAWSDEPRQVLVLNRAAARLFFGERNPIGSRLSGREIIGVVGDAVYLSAREGVPPTAYFLSRAGYGTLIVRSASGDPARLTGRIVDSIVRADPDVLIHVTPLAAFARVTVAAERATAMLAGFFGVLALVLAAVGTYGVMAYAVSRRLTELAVRRALGATGADVMRMVLGRSALTAAIGVLLGATVSIWVSGLLEPLLFGVEPVDLTILAGASAVLVAVAIAATVWPARRAAGLNPAILLRDC